MLLSHGDYNGSKVSLRVMQFDQWVNSKVYFFSSRSKFIPGRAVSEAQTPVMVHMSAPPALLRAALPRARRPLARSAPRPARPARRLPPG
jgi:hypothetical protein